MQQNVLRCNSQCNTRRNALSQLKECFYLCSMIRQAREFKTSANEFGIMIKECCASCANRCFDDKELRYCQLTGRHVRGKGVCDNWSMSEGLKTLGGQERGKVQCRDYQLTLMEIRVSELKAVMMGKEVAPTSVESIRRDYELKHQSRFVIR